ncbi:hypothetical protein AVDCRST_MAG81-1288 [uncultured Synechococcales cyanobacterium]|uniref:Uncharacterized protein n=1 Tax=uncultured Synechococcales cyanobacterium TaxID=1936017 RepID=A0A6J4V5Z3_9CYAN|nr:hypothetical protein AVDCRST_MAG81-1288 [uncultured Synechococcales cyanobacterium]
MDVEDNYDYSGSEYFIQKFENPMAPTPFIDDVVENYGTLWRFVDCIKSWSFSMSGKKVQITVKVNDDVPYVHLNRFERVTFIEQQRHEYIVLGIQAFNDAGVDLPHCHSIVVKVGTGHGQFDFIELLESVVRSGQGALKEAFEKYLPWTNEEAEKVNRRLVRIHQLLSAFEARPVPVDQPQRRRARGKASAGAELDGSASAAPQGSSRAPARRTSTNAATAVEPASKKRKSAAGGSSTSTVTRASTPIKSRNDPQVDFQKITESQRQFWAECRGCFPFESSYSVRINQCIVAKAQYVIRGMEEGIVRNAMDFLVQLGEINQRQKICICPVDKDGEPIKRKPNSWDEIKDGKFMLINGQHSVEASRRLQDNSNCGADRKKDLQHWDAYVVWSTDPLKLQRISKFYNDTNHLDHAQPTWGNQISSCRRIWLNSGRPSYQKDEGATRGNGAVFDQEKYMVSCWAVVYPRLEDKQ